jgi:hypothetical protein
MLLEMYKESIFTLTLGAANHLSLDMLRDLPRHTPIHLANPLRTVPLTPSFD